MRFQQNNGIKIKLYIYKRCKVSCLHRCKRIGTRGFGNDYVADLRLRYHIGKAMLTDNVNDTISYADVYDIVKETMQQPAKLLEYVAHRIVEKVGAGIPRHRGDKTFVLLN